MEMKLDYSDVSFKNNGKLKLLIIVGTRHFLFFLPRKKQFPAGEKENAGKRGKTDGAYTRADEPVA